MKNFKIMAVEDGKEYWISRSMAVAAYVFNGDYILATKRGKGAADNHGKWCVPCGYLDYNETLVQAAAREVMEETGFALQWEGFRFVGLCDDPRENRQNVTVSFVYKVTDKVIPRIPPMGGEDEVEKIMWIHKDNIDNYKWAFNHDKRIKELCFTE